VARASRTAAVGGDPDAVCVMGRRVCVCAGCGQRGVTWIATRGRTTARSATRASRSSITTVRGYVRVPRVVCEPLALTHLRLVCSLSDGQVHRRQQLAVLLLLHQQSVRFGPIFDDRGHDSSPRIERVVRSSFVNRCSPNRAVGTLRKTDQRLEGPATGLPPNSVKPIGNGPSCGPQRRGQRDARAG
jgi:hypothetical protein